MYEPISLVKVRKARTITIPAGDWMLLCLPGQPLHEHLEARRKLVAAGPANDEFEAVLIGRLQDINPPFRFVTSGEATAAIERQAAADKSLRQHHTDALQRQKDLAAAESEKQRRQHEARVAELNREHDRIRHRDAATPTLAAVESEADAEAKVLTELNSLSKAELIDLIARLNSELGEENKITVAPDAKKPELVAAIVQAKSAAH